MKDLWTAPRQTGRSSAATTAGRSCRPVIHSCVTLRDCLSVCLSRRGTRVYVQTRARREMRNLETITAAGLRQRALQLGAFSGNVTGAAAVLRLRHGAATWLGGAARAAWLDSGDGASWAGIPALSRWPTAVSALAVGAVGLSRRGQRVAKCCWA